jgi:5-(carboxyamino)imidazole ribonucleotide synthase
MSDAMQVNRIGVIGGGQLAWMLLEAAVPLNLELTIQTPSNSDPAVANATQTGQAVKAVLAPVGDSGTTAQLAQTCEVITFENEFVDLPALQQLAASGVCFRPDLSVLLPLLDKYQQRSFLQSLELPVPAFHVITPSTSPKDLDLAFPWVIKARRHGYDGQGTFIIKTAEELRQFWRRFQDEGQGPTLNDRFMVEAFVPFNQELAILAARSVAGDIALYPIVETYQPEQVCRWAIAPARIPVECVVAIEEIARRLLEGLDVVGILGIELFLTEQGQVLINEIAPRTHNSGHLTIEACPTSQFEQQLRAVSGHPLGEARLTCPGAVMVNLLGYESARSDYKKQREQLAKISNAHVHWYGKAESRPGRKLGHVTVLLERADRDVAIAAVQQIEGLWYGNPQTKE